MVEAASELPPDVHPQVLFTHIQHKYNLPDVFVLDLWPISWEATMIISDPEVMKQFTQKRVLPKHPAIQYWIGHVIGPTSMISSDGEPWKRSRVLFNTSFSNAHLMTLVGTIVDHTLIFCEKLEEFADRNELFHLDNEATRLTIDVIGRVALDDDFNAQRGEHELVTAFRQSILWGPKASEINPFVNYSPLRLIMVRIFTHRMDRYLGKLLDQRIAAHTPSTADTQTRRKPAIELAIGEYYAQQQAKSSSGSTWKTEDKAFKKQAIDNMKTFIFAGHDTTSSTISYMYHQLSKHPDSLARVRAEHDTVFGSDLSQTVEKIKEQPHLLNQLPFTHAIIKETLRLYPPADPARKGLKDIHIHQTARTPALPTYPYFLMLNLHALHRSPVYFPSPLTFSPARFLPAASRDDPSCPQGTTEIPPEAYRPFERGPRNCIGQELAVLEVKVVMVLTLRAFDVWADYDADESADADKGVDAAKKGPKKDVVREVDGDRAYQALIATAKPAEGMPARVKRRVEGD
ncbi:MAG: hypothetical protein M1833_003509 [Piccolia ochrophora]|nr:MAG: hypothetical protein M1833_003509 [Piccolia ochrophora]